MTSAGGYKPSQPAQVVLFPVIREAATCSCALGLSVFFFLVCFRLSIEPWSSIYVKRSNYAPSEQAQEVKVTDPPKQSTEPNAARRLLGGSCKSPCATVKKGRGGFHRNGRVCVIISYGIAAKCRAKKSISSGRRPAVSGNDNLRSASGWQRHVLDTGQQQRATQTHRPSDLNFDGLQSPQTRKHFSFFLPWGTTDVHPLMREPAATLLPLRWASPPEAPRSLRVVPRCLNIFTRLPCRAWVSLEANYLYANGQA